MKQGALDFGLDDRAERHYQRFLRVMGDVVDEMGLDVVTGACDASRSTVLDALSDREHRSWRQRWTLRIWEVANPDQKARIERACFPVQRELTPEEKLARLELRVVERLGPVGVQLVEENRR